MHKLQKKRGKKTVTHHFHHVTEKDGSKKHVYLGTDPEKAQEKLTKIQLARMRSQNKLVKDMEKVQTKLNKLGHYNRSYDSTLTEVRQRYNKQRQLDKLLSQEVRTAFPFKGYVIIFLALFVISASMFYFLSSPTPTGAAVQEVKDFATDKVFTTSISIFAVIMIIGLVLHAVDYRRKHKHDKYKPPR
jgi:hypothetical protein